MAISERAARAFAAVAARLARVTAAFSCAAVLASLPQAAAGASTTIGEALRTPLAAPGTAPERVTLPEAWDRLRPPRQGAWRYRILVPRAAFAGDYPSLLIPRAGNTLEVSIDGLPITLIGRKTAPYLDYSNQPHLVTIPRALITTDPVAIDIDIYGNARRNAGLSAVVAGAREDLEGAFRADVWIARYTVWLLASASFLAGIFALLIWLRNRDVVFGLFAIGSLAWGARTASLLVHEPFLPDALWQYLYYVSLSLYLCPLALFFLHVLEVKSCRLAQYIKAYLWLSFPVCLVAVLAGRYEIRAAWLIAANFIPLAVFVLAVNECVRRPRSVAAVLAVASGAALTAALRDWWVIQYSGEYAAYTTVRFAAPFFILAQAWVLTDRYDRSIKALAQFNRVLETRVASREREIETLYAEARIRENQQATRRERERIMREMHDGLGGRLATAAVIAMRRDVPADVRDAIQESLNELRLALDVSNVIGEDLNTVLATLRHRMEPGLRAAGFRLEWSVDTLPQAEGSVSGEHMMHVVRIVQESIANAVKHSGGDAIRVEARCNDDHVELVVRDNGRGVREAVDGGGRGLANMRHRAAELGGTLTVTGSAEGTVVRLELPRAASAPGAQAAPEEARTTRDAPAAVAP